MTSGNSSGIGPAEHVRELGITVVQDTPAVGWNMVYSLVSVEMRPWVFSMELLRYLIWGTGLLIVPVLGLAIFTQSKLLDGQGALTSA